MRSQHFSTQLLWALSDRSSWSVCHRSGGISVMLIRSPFRWHTRVRTFPSVISLANYYSSGYMPASIDMTKALTLSSVPKGPRIIPKGFDDEWFFMNGVERLKNSDLKLGGSRCKHVVWLWVSGGHWETDNVVFVICPPYRDWFDQLILKLCPLALKVCIYIFSRPFGHNLVLDT